MRTEKKMGEMPQTYGAGDKSQGGIGRGTSGAQERWVTTLTTTVLALRALRAAAGEGMNLREAE